MARGNCLADKVAKSVAVNCALPPHGTTVSYTQSVPSVDIESIIRTVKDR